MELWKPIPSTDNQYEISNLGNIRTAKTKFQLKPQTVDYIGNGRPFVVLRIHGSRKTVYIARTVAQAFIDNPFGFGYVYPKDGDVTNCRADNLEWSKKRQPNQDMTRSFKQRAKRCQCVETGRICDTIHEMSEVLGVSACTVSYAIKNGRKIKKKYTVVRL